MIASWMLYALVVSALVGAAAWVLEEVCRLLGSPVRWVWLCGLLATVGLVALAPLPYRHTREADGAHVRPPTADHWIGGRPGA